jgi:hypothetical protein
MRLIKLGILLSFGFSSGACLLAQQDGRAAGPELKSWTTQEDHQNMMGQLGIRKLRPGPSGNETAPNHANYDESLANPFPNLPPLLVLKNGKKVTSAEMWWKQRRPEIVEDFEREVLERHENGRGKSRRTSCDRQTTRRARG